MNQQLYKQIIEAAIFANNKPLTIKHLKDGVLFRFKLTSKQIAALLDEVTIDYSERGIVLVERGSGFEFVTRSDLSEYLNCLWQEKAPRYSRALLETLALIAYKQPITRAEIESIRGVAVSSQIMKTLTERCWIKVVGQKEVPGKPALYGTSKEFLDYFGLTTLAQLPQLTDNQLEAAIADFEQQ